MPSIYQSIYPSIHPSAYLTVSLFTRVSPSCLCISFPSLSTSLSSFVGCPGCGKSSLLENILSLLKSRLRSFSSHTVNLNYHSDATSLLISLQSVLHKRTESAYGPSGTNKKLVYFIDGTYGKYPIIYVL